jgi:dCMP deaminase
LYLDREEVILMAGRIDRTNYYLNIAEAVLDRGTCLRRNYGAVIVHNDEIISTGYTGAPRGCKNCVDAGYCEREYNNIPSGTQYELCKSVHAEANACLSAARRDMIGAVLYLCGKTYKTGAYVVNAEPCLMCKRLIINAGIKFVIARVDKVTYKLYNVEEWLD